MTFRFGVLALGLVGMAAAAAADTIVAGASKDNTLYNDGTGGLSNGAGWYMFCGPAGVHHRALVAFDLGAIPAGSTIQSVKLTLNCSRSPLFAPPVDCAMHRVLADWGEGASDAGEPGGSGTAPAPGDATWVHTFYPGSLWTTPGGDFDPIPSAVQTCGGTGLYDWGSSAGLVADVQGWVDNPPSNFGWILIGDETQASNGRRFDTHENPNAEFRPRLQVDFTPGLVGTAGAAWTAVKALYR